LKLQRSSSMDYIVSVKNFFTTFPSNFSTSYEWQVTCVLRQENALNRKWCKDIYEFTEFLNMVNSLCFPLILPQQIDMKGNIWLWQCQRGIDFEHPKLHGVLNPYITMLWMLSNVYLLFPCFLVLLSSDVPIKCVRAWRVWKAGVPVPCMLRNRPSQQQGLIAKTWFLLLDKMYHGCILPSM
jgi:hypothetical protein